MGFCSKSSASISTFSNKNSDYNRLACKIAIANLGDPVKEESEGQKKKVKGKERKENTLSDNKP